MKQFPFFILVSLLLFSCCSRPKITFDPTRPGITQVSNECYRLNFSEADGGVVQEVYFEKDLILEKLEDFYPNEENNYRQTKARILDDGESLISATYHKQPKMTMNRSFVILDDEQGIKLSWTVKNTGNAPIIGQRKIRFLIKGSEIESSLKNGILKVKLVTWRRFIQTSPNGTYDYVLEHTCYCAVPRENRRAYMESAHQRLKPEGHLFGLFYRFDPPDLDGPPYSLSMEEFETSFEGLFELISCETPKLSHGRRTNRERLVVLKKI